MEVNMNVPCFTKEELEVLLNKLADVAINEPQNSLLMEATDALHACYKAIYGEWLYMVEN
jgi:hypothetical protein